MMFLLQLMLIVVIFLQLLSRVFKISCVCVSCNFVLFLMAVVFLNSCKKHVSVPVNDSPENFSEIFAQFWQKMNVNYVFWDKDNTDWDVMYKVYKPKFDELEVTDKDKAKAISYFREMTNDLIDHHFSITFNEAPIAGSVINPGLERKARSSDYRARYDYSDVVQRYLDDGFLSEKGNISLNGLPIRVIAGTINGNQLYFNCNFFALKESYYSADGAQIRKVLDYFFSEIGKNQFKFKGVILDLRNNFGGNLDDLSFFAGKLINRDALFGYSRSKIGTGKFDYSPWLEARLRRDLDFHLDVPIVILGDNYTASLSEIMIIALKSEKNVFIGEQTFGATGPLSDSEIFNSGSFQIGKFLTVQTSAVEFKGIDDFFYEGVGITPDVISKFNLSKLSEGKDLQLELAISHLDK